MICFYEAYLVFSLFAESKIYRSKTIKKPKPDCEKMKNYLLCSAEYIAVFIYQNHEHVQVMFYAY